MLRYLYKFRFVYIYRWSGIIQRSVFRLFGMKIGKGSKVGNLKVTWPHRVKIGNNSVIEKAYLKYDGPYGEGYRIIIGNQCFIGMGVEINCCHKIIIKDHVLIASGTKIVDHNHSITKGSLIHKQPSSDICKIVIEEDVWIGFNSVLLPGSKMGKGSVLAAQSVLNREMGEYEIWAGIPARKIGMRQL